MAFIIKTCSLYIHLGKSFSHEWMLNFVKCFFCIYWDDHEVFVFSFVYMAYHIDSRMLNHPCELGWIALCRIPLGRDVWSFLCVVGFGLLMFCWEFLHLYSSKILACNFPFWWCLCLVLVSGWWWLHWMSLEVFPPLQFFARVWEGWVWLLLCMFGRIHLRSHPILGFCLLEKFFFFF